MNFILSFVLVDGRFYHEGKTLEFEGIENEWPMFYLYMIIDGVFIGDDIQVSSTLYKIYKNIVI